MDDIILDERAIEFACTSVAKLLTEVIEETAGECCGRMIGRKERQQLFALVYTTVKRAIKAASSFGDISLPEGLGEDNGNEEENNGN